MCLLVFAVFVASCGGGGSSSGAEPPKPTGALAHDAEVLRGRTVFGSDCATCHGISGEGGVGPSFADGKLQQDFADTDAQVAFVQQGKDAMPAFAGLLTNAQIHAVVRYEREVLSHPK